MQDSAAFVTALLAQVPDLVVVDVDEDQRFCVS
jgi:hypothetical protein